MSIPTASSSPAAPRSRSWFNRYTISLAVLALLGAGGYAAWRWRMGSQSEADQYLLSTVQRGDIEDLVTATGSLQPRDYVDVGAQVSGQLKKIHVEVGSVVREGDLLAEIDPTVYRATVDARRANLRNLQASMVDKQSAVVLAKLQLDRQRNLLAGEATTTESLQQAEATMRSAKAQADALQAQIEQQESTLQADEANLNYARIYAPISGVVVSISARQGQTLNASQQAPVLLRVADLSTMTVQTQVSEADIGQLHPDMDAYFTTLGNRGRRWWGKLRKVEPTPTVTNNVVLYNALFDVSNDQRNLLPQMTAQVFFVAATAQDALLVPASAVTMQRAGRDKRSGPAGAVAASAAVSVPLVVASEAERGVAKAVHDKDQPPAKPAARAGKDKQPSGDAPDWSSMSREERQARMASMSPEERDALRERMRARRAEREAAGESPMGDRSAQPADKRAGAGAPERNSAKVAPAASAVSALPVWAGVSAARQRAPREATVKVALPDGRLEERKVKVGISNRVQVQVLEGLKEGDKVVAGLKLPPQAANKGDGAQRNALQGQGGMQQGMGQGQGAGGAGGRAR
jgi:macrolide-specific efflux system membrane fusion protein